MDHFGLCKRDYHRWVFFLYSYRLSTRKLKNVSEHSLNLYLIKHREKFLCSVSSDNDSGYPAIEDTLLKKDIPSNCVYSSRIYSIKWQILEKRLF